MLSDFFLETYARIPAKSSRVHIERTVTTYLASYADDDIIARAALFASDAIAEEPVGGLAIRGRDGLIAFWRQANEAGWRTSNCLQRLVVNGDEAFIQFRSDLTVPGQGTVSLDVFETLAFDPAGLIQHLRAFNDATCLHNIVPAGVE